MEDEMTMHEVSKDDFHAWLKGEKRDVHPRLIGNKWPYTSLFRTKSGEVLGKIETYIPEGSALSKNRYFTAAGALDSF